MAQGVVATDDMVLQDVSSVGNTRNDATIKADGLDKAPAIAGRSKNSMLLVYIPLTKFSQASHKHLTIIYERVGRPYSQLCILHSSFREPNSLQCSLYAGGSRHNGAQYGQRCLSQLVELCAVSVPLYDTHWLFGTRTVRASLLLANVDSKPAYLTALQKSLRVSGRNLHRSVKLKNTVSVRQKQEDITC